MIKVLLLLLLTLSLPGHAFRLDPMSTSIELKGGQKHVNFIIENETDQPLPVQIDLFERKIKENGQDELSPTDDVVAFPDQVIIPPEQKRSVKVTFTGDAKALKEEKAYRFVAEQLPLDLGQKKKSDKGIKLLLKYIAALYVTPSDTEAKIDCEFISSLLCRNTGSAHQIVNFKTLELSAGASTLKFNQEELKKISGENILPHGSRTFHLNFRPEVKTLKAPVKVHFKLE